MPHLVGLLADRPDARLVAGATDFIPFVQAGKWQPAYVFDISSIGELRYIQISDDWIEIGALTTHSEVAASALLNEKATALSEAAASIADPQIRGRATVGGNICTASPAADTVPSLLALDAESVLVSATGERHMSLVTFLLGPGKTALRPGEVLTAIRFRVPAPGTGTRFIKLGRRNAMAISVANVAALVQTRGAQIVTGRLALGAVAPTAMRCAPAEAYLEGMSLDALTFAAAAARVRETICPIDDVRASAAYRRVVAVELARRALVDAGERASKDALNHEVMKDFEGRRTRSARITTRGGSGDLISAGSQ